MDYIECVIGIITIFCSFVKILRVSNLPKLENGKTILIAPLNWGLGHATRLIPVIRNYKKTNTVILAGNRPSLSILTQIFPDLKAIELPEQNFRFDTHFFSPLNLFRFSQQLKQAIENDKKAINQIIKTQHTDIIISDNRYGVWHPATKNILITHQLMLKLPSFWSFLEKVVHHKVISKIKPFDECWIPDFETDKNLSGDLSHKYPLLSNVKFIGPLSRFENKISSGNENTKKVLVILSGPEPQRTYFEERLEKIFLKNNISATMLLGKPISTQSTDNDLIRKISHTSDNEFIELIRNHEIIISRAGYSTIMDFYFLQKPVVLVPTPKQTEQLYLASYLKNHPLFSFVEENDIEDYLTGLPYTQFHKK